MKRAQAAFVVAVFAFLSLGATKKEKPVKLIIKTDPATGITTILPSDSLTRSGLYVNWEIQPREAFDANGKRSIGLLIEIRLVVGGVQSTAFGGQVAMNVDGNRMILPAEDFLQDTSCDTCLYWNYPLSIAKLQALASAKANVHIEIIGTGSYSGITEEMHLKSKDVVKLSALCLAILDRKTPKVN